VNACILPFPHVLRQAVQYRAEAFAAAGKHVVVTGDLNICPHPLDHCEPDMKHFYACRPDRRWLMDMLEPEGGPFVDGFRLHHPHRWRSCFVCFTAHQRHNRTLLVRSLCR